MRFPTLKIIEATGLKYQVMISDGPQLYKIYRSLERLNTSPSFIHITRRAPSGEQMVRPTFAVDDGSTLTSVILVNEIKTLFKFLPDNVSVTTVRYMLRAMAEHYNKIEGHKTKPQCRVSREDIIEKILFSNDAASRLRAAAEVFGIYVEKGKT